MLKAVWLSKASHVYSWYTIFVKEWMGSHSRISIPRTFEWQKTCIQSYILSPGMAMHRDYPDNLGVAAYTKQAISVVCMGLVMAPQRILSSQSSFSHLYLSMWDRRLWQEVKSKHEAAAGEISKRDARLQFIHGVWLTEVLTVAHGSKLSESGTDGWSVGFEGRASLAVPKFHQPAFDVQQLQG